MREGKPIQIGEFFLKLSIKTFIYFSWIELGWRITIISPDELSANMLAPNRTNLNEISHNTAINLIRATIESGVNVTEVYISPTHKKNFF